MRLLSLFAGCCVLVVILAASVSVQASHPSSSSPLLQSVHDEYYSSIHLLSEALLEQPINEREAELRGNAQRELLQAGTGYSTSTSSSSVSSHPQTFPHSTYLLRVKVPFTESARVAIEEYLFPYKLGEYVPHHTWTVTVGVNGGGGSKEQDGTTKMNSANTAASSSSSIHPHFHLSSPHSSHHRSHPHYTSFLSHPTTSTLSEVETMKWLAHAPGILEVKRYQPKQKVHAKLMQVMRVEKERLRSEKYSAATKATTTSPHPNWSFMDFGEETKEAAQKWMRPLSIAGDMMAMSNLSSSSAVTSSITSSIDSFRLIHLTLTLFSHPLHQHSPSSLLRAHTSGGEEQAKWRKHEEDAMSHLTRVVETWAVQLRSNELNLDELHIQRGGVAEEMIRQLKKVKVTWARYDPRSSTSLSSSTSIPSSPHHIHFLLLTPTLLRVYTSTWLLPLVLEFLQHRNEIQWIEPSSMMRTHNKYVRGIIQDDVERENTNPVIDGNNNMNYSTSLWNHGIHGEGEIIQVGDTGIDIDSCFFSDLSGASVPVNTYTTNHRKLVSYILFENADVGDDVDGHGTHVTGTVAGQVNVPSSSGYTSLTHPLMPFNGVANSAKLAFYDFKKNGDGNPELLVPPTLYQPYLGEAYTKGGARISSNSWGSQDGSYNSYAQELDKFAWDFPDSLLIFAAGNYGEAGYSSISSPSVAKNILTVGSVKTSDESYRDSGVDYGLLVSTPVPQSNSSLDQLEVRISLAKFGTIFRSLPFVNQSKVVVANPLDACSDLQNSPSEFLKGDDPLSVPEGVVLLVKRGPCQFSQKAYLAQIFSDAGVAASPLTFLPILLVVIYNDQLGPPFPMGQGDYGARVNLSTVMVTQTVGESIRQTIAGGNITVGVNNTVVTLPPTPVYLTFPYLVHPSNTSIADTLSSFSSRGPTYNGRIKPDVLGTGEFVRSVRSDGMTSPLGSAATCPTDVEKGILQLEGTSMATPAVAGAAALLRQYLRLGFYPSGEANTASSISSPTSALLKAMLIHSSVASPTSEVLTKRSGEAAVKIEQVKVAPSYMQGWGRVLLKNVARFTGNESASTIVTPPEPQPNIEIFEATNLTNPQIQTDGIHSFCYMVKAPQSATRAGAARNSLPYFRATIVWTDAPTSSPSSFVLVNNLDLFVVAPVQQSMWIGNSMGFVDVSLPAGVQGTLPPRTLEWDRENNVEVVNIQASEISTTGSVYIPILVHVRGTNILSGSQNYALVVTGWFDDVVGASDPVTSAPNITKHLPIGTCLNAIPPAIRAVDPFGILCPGDCGASEKRGVCSWTSGQCTCATDYTGADCSQQARKMNYTASSNSWSTDSAIVPVEGWLYYSFSLVDVNPSWKRTPGNASSGDATRITSEINDYLSDFTSFLVVPQRQIAVGDPDLFVSFLTFPTRRTSDLSNIACDNCGLSPDVSQLNIGIDRIKQHAARLVTDAGVNDKIRVGIYGSCCDVSVVTMTITPYKPSSNHLPPAVWIVPLLLGLLLMAFLWYALKYYRRAPSPVSGGVAVGGGGGGGAAARRLPGVGRPLGHSSSPPSVVVSHSRNPMLLSNVHGSDASQLADPIVPSSSSSSPPSSQQASFIQLPSHDPNEQLHRPSDAGADIEMQSRV